MASDADDSKPSSSAKKVVMLLAAEPRLPRFMSRDLPRPLPSLKAADRTCKMCVDGFICLKKETSLC